MCSIAALARKAGCEGHARGYCTLLLGVEIGIVEDHAPFSMMTGFFSWDSRQSEGGWRWDICCGRERDHRVSCDTTVGKKIQWMDGCAVCYDIIFQLNDVGGIVGLSGGRRRTPLN